MKNYAYISLIATNNYIYPAIALMTSGKRTCPKYPFYLMITKDITEDNREILGLLGYHLIDIEEYMPTNYADILNNKQLSEKDYLMHGKNNGDNGWRHAYSKLLIGNLTQFDKVCGLDLDMLIFQNIDDIFDYSAPCYLEGDKNKYIYSQLMLIEPSKAFYQVLKRYCDNFQGSEDIYTDEEMLNSFLFKYRKHAPQRIPLLYCYQINQTNINDEPIIEDFGRIKALHLSVQQKPWIYGKQFVANFTDDGYIGAFFYIYYIDVLNQGLEELNEKGYNFNLIP